MNPFINIVTITTVVVLALIIAAAVLNVNSLIGTSLFVSAIVVAVIGAILESHRARSVK